MTDFNHLQSAHCENGVTTSLLQHYGVDFLTEPLSFGIGSGLFYIHIPFLKLNNGPSISYRSMPGLIFKRTCKALGIEVKRKKFNSPEKAQTYLNTLVDAGKPVGCQVGVFHLPYFPPEYRFHFNAHNLIVYGREGDTYFVSDPIMETHNQLSAKELEKVRFAKGVLAPKGQIYYPENVGIIDPKRVKTGIEKGIQKTAHDMVKIPVPFIGVKGIKYTANHIRKWRDKLGERKAGLYLGHIVRMQEEIGTGGGGFRFVYAAFLQEAAEILEMDELSVISEDITKAGDLWRASAIQMAGIYKGRISAQSDFNTSAGMLDEISELEKAAFVKLGKLKFK